MKHLVAILFTALIPLYFQAQTERGLELLTINDGLSQGFVNSIIQDREGFLWIGTKNGLNRYDGNQFLVFTNNPFDEKSISNDWIKVIYDYGDYLLLGNARNGLDIFNKKTFEVFKPQAKNDSLSLLQHASFNRIKTDKLGQIWLQGAIGHSSNHLVSIKLPQDLETIPSEKLKEQVHFKDWGSWRFVDVTPDGSQVWASEGKKFCKIEVEHNKQEIIHSKIELFQEANFYRLIAEGRNNIWAMLESALCNFNGKNWEYFPFDVPVRSLHLLNDSEIGFFKDLDFYIIPKKDLQTTNLKLGNFQPQFESKKTIRSNHLMVDNSGIIWFGTNGLGAAKFNPVVKKFNHTIKNLSINRYLMVFPDDAIGYDASNFHFQKNMPDHLPLYQHIFKTSRDKLVIDSKNNLWFLTNNSTKKNGEDAFFLNLHHFDPHQKTLRESIVSFPSQSNYDNAFSIDESDNIWIAVKDSLIQYRPSEQTFQVYKYEQFINQRHQIQDLKKTPNGHWWIATNYGLIQAIPNNSGFDFKLHRINPKEENSPHHKDISCLLPDPNNPNHLWIATKGGGLNLLDLKSFRFSHLTQEKTIFSEGDFLPNNVIYAVLPDEQGNLWMSSNKGIIKYNPSTGSIRNYTIEDGLPSNEFNSRAYAKDSRGNLHFGSIEGLISFHPSSLKDNPISPKVAIINLEVNNQKVTYGDGSGILKQNIEYTSEITLPYSQNSITLEFAALEYSAPSKNTFQYYLDGAEQPWIHKTKDRRASYLDLSPGIYHFKLKAANNNGIWSEETKVLKITILPPWYRTNFFYSLYVVLIIGLGYVLMRFSLYRQRIKHEILLEQKEAERLKELDDFKTRLYTNITHEFRTPLTVILGMADEIAQAKIQTPKETFKHNANLITRHGRNLLRLINQILDLAKLEAKERKLQLINGDIIIFVKYLWESFHSFAQTKNVKLHFLSDLDNLALDFDKNGIQDILSNLISNAIKFSPAGGDVYLQMSELENYQTFLNSDFIIGNRPSHSHEGNWLKISVKDTGKGIPQNDLKHIFDRFYQVKNANESAQKGSGIGLSLVQELVKLMQGGFAVRSKKGKGTEFVILLPILSSGQHLDGNMQLSMEHPLNLMDAPKKQKAKNQLEAENTLLIIEDNIDVAEYIQACVSDNYKVLFAQNGLEGINLAIEQIPDIIISDVMMPLKDGYEVVSTLKKDEKTSHIPIILLTAKADHKSKLEGLESGADAFLIKPFDKKELLIRLEKLLEIRQKLQKHYFQLAARNRQSANDITPLKTEKQPEILEDAFLLKLRNLIEKNISDPDFGIPQLCKKLGMSRSQIFRKVKALTGKSPSLFIRSIRLNKAKEMLQTTDLNVSEVAYEVGFTSPVYFSDTFLEEFGLRPNKIHK